jgi:hypothetical protein
MDDGTAAYSAAPNKKNVAYTAFRPMSSDSDDQMNRRAHGRETQQSDEAQ